MAPGAVFRAYATSSEHHYKKNVSEKMKIQADFELYTLFTKLQRPLNDEIF